MAVSAGPSGRPASGRRCRVDTPWRPYAGAGPTSQARARLKYATTPPVPPPPFLFPLLHRASRGGGKRCHRRRVLRRARVRSSPRLASFHLAHGFTVISSTSSTSSLCRKVKVEATFPLPPRRSAITIVSSDELPRAHLRTSAPSVSSIAPTRPPLASHLILAVNRPRVRSHSTFPRRRNLVGVGCSVASSIGTTSAPPLLFLSFPRTR